MLILEYLAQLAASHAADLNSRVRSFSIGDRSFGGDASSIMGVINLSPDSWYRESVCLAVDQAIARGQTLRTQGADIVDIGAESTLANADRADAELQKKKLLPVVQALSAAGVLVSTETYSPVVASACLEAGTKVLNLTGMKDANAIYRLAAAAKAAVIICYVQGDNPREVADFDFGADPIEKMRQYFAREIDKATSAGVDKIFLDPGLGFYYRNLGDSALRVGYQMKVFFNTFRLRLLGWPVCHALPHAFEFFGEEVRTAESFFAVLAALGKTSLFRTHEVAKIAGVLKTLRSFPAK